MVGMEAEALAATLRDAGMLDRVLRLARAATPPWQLVDVVIQDEFTHDVVLSVVGAAPTDPALVLDCT
jgi:hypothetical protein